MERARSARDGGSIARKIGPSPAKRSSDFSFHQKEFRSSIELAKKFKHIKQEKIDKLHERLQGNTRQKVQEVVEVVEGESPLKLGTTKKRTRGKITTDRLDERLQGNNREKVQEIADNLNKNTDTKKKERLKVNREAMKGLAHVGKYTNQDQQVINTNKEVVEGTTKKRTCGKATMDILRERLHGNNRGVEEVDSNLKRKIVASEIPMHSTKPKQQDKHKLSLETMISKTQCSKRVPTYPSMSIDDFIQLQHSKEKVATKSLEGDRPTSIRNRGEHLRQPEVMEEFAQVEGDINQEVEEATNTNREEKEGEGTSKRRTRGKTLCKDIHARTMDEREVIFNEDGQPIGPSNKVVSDLSIFLGTLARNSAFCPLIYTSWTDMPDDNIKRIWKYTNKKFILSDEARDWIETAVRDAWRRYKHHIKKNHFLEYSNMTEGLKHRPSKVPESHFRKLCEYWSLETIQSVSERNKRNRAQLKWRHRMGPKNFAIIRERLRAKENKEPTQAEIFIETRKGDKGKQLDDETKNTISQLQEMIENEESDDKAIQAVLGEEHPGMVRCYGRNVTKTSLKRKKEINDLKRAHNEEVSSLNEKVQNMEDMVGKLKYAFKTLLQHCKPGISMESLEDFFVGLSPGDASSAQKVVGQPHMHSSTSTHLPNLGKQRINEDTNEEQGLNEEDIYEEWQDDMF